jgi:hypothetical protein
VELRLLSGSQLFRDMAEFRRAARHRYMLANYAGLTIPAVVLLYALDSTRMPIDLQVPSVVVGLVSAHVLLVTYLTVVARLMQTLHKEARIVRVWVTPGIVLGAAGLLGVTHIMHQIMEVQQDWTNVQTPVVPFLCVLYLEVAVTLLFRGPMPRALARLRGGKDPLAEFLVAAETVDAGVPVLSEAKAEAEGPSGSGELLVRLGLTPAEVLRLEASGNYVTVVAETGRHLVPGPFSAVVAQMPAGIGRQVQRSHWVARSAVEGVKRQGRDLLLQLACGALVPVSSAMKAEVQAWLDGKQMAGRPVSRTGAGRNLEGSA